jgi:hypothetical protein
VKDTLEKLGVTKEKLAKEYIAMAFSNITDVMTDDGELKGLNQLTVPARKAVKSIKRATGRSRSTSVEMHDKHRALEKLVKWFGVEDGEGNPLGGGGMAVIVETGIPYAPGGAPEAEPEEEDDLFS